MIQAAMRMNCWQKHGFLRSQCVSTMIQTFHKFSDVLNTRKQQLEHSLSTVSVISWAACPDSNSSENSGTQQYEGFVHDGSSNKIRMGTLKRVLPEKVVSEAVEIIQATFEEIHPGRGNHYAEHPIIKKYLEETTLDPLACSVKKRLRKDFRGSSTIIFQINASKTWFGHGTINCFNA